MLRFERSQQSTREPRMDDQQFDRLTRALSSRRTALRGLLGGSLALLGLSPDADVAAHNLIPGCKKIKDVKKRQACLKRAKRHNKQRHSCKAQSISATCAGRCGVWKNNCGKGVPCLACPTGHQCLGNGSCARTCSDANPVCPATCGACGYPTTEGTRACIAAIDLCPTQTCSSTSQCSPGFHCQPCERGGPNYCFPLCAA